MTKVALLAVIATLTVSMSAQAQGIQHKRHVASKGSNQCWIATDIRGFGYWESCDARTPAERAHLSEVLSTLNTNGGGGGGGGGR